MSNYTNENASQNMKGNVLHIRNESVSHDRLSHDRNANASYNMKGNVSHNRNEKCKMIGMKMHHIIWREMYHIIGMKRVK